MCGAAEEITECAGVDGEVEGCGADWGGAGRREAGEIGEEVLEGCAESKVREAIEGGEGVESGLQGGDVSVMCFQWDVGDLLARMLRRLSRVDLGEVQLWLLRRGRSRCRRDE